MSDLAAGIKSLVEREAKLVIPAAAQKRPWSCGPAALVNACAVLGLNVTEDQVMAITKTDARGTSEDQVISAAKAFGLSVGVIHGSDPSVLDDLILNLDEGCSAILCVDHWEHWVTAIAASSGSVTLQDPADGSTEAIPLASLVARWRCGGEAHPFYAIILGLAE